MDIDSQRVMILIGLETHAQPPHLQLDQAATRHMAPATVRFTPTSYLTLLLSLVIDTHCPIFANRFNCPFAGHSARDLS